MKDFRKSAIKAGFLILVLIGVALGNGTVSTVRADVGVRPVLPGGSSIQPREQTPIQNGFRTCYDDCPQGGCGGQFLSIIKP